MFIVSSKIKDYFRVHNFTKFIFLQIHTTISISPPVLCGKLVQTYKSKCKQRLQQIKKGQLEVDIINESILIEDSN